MGSRMLILRTLLLLICAFHVVVGVGVNVSPEFPKIMATYYGATGVEWTGQFVYMLRPLGAFMFVMGLLAAVAAMNPIKHRAICYGFSALFFIRGLQRIAFQDDIQAAFGIAPGRNTINMAFFIGLGVVLLIFHALAAMQSRKAARSK